MSEEILKWIPVLAVFIAGFFALHQIKSNNIINARLKWLENFKQLVAEFMSECNSISIKQGVSKAIAAKGQLMHDPEAKKYSDKIAEELILDLKVLSLKHDLIKLALNPNEKLHRKFEKVLNDYMILFNQYPQSLYASEAYKQLTKNMDDHLDTFLELSRYIIKLEWERTKRGYLRKQYYFTFGKGQEIIITALELPVVRTK